MKIPKDIFFPLNTSKTKRGLGSSIPSPSFSLQDWLKDNKIKGQEFYIEDKISAPVFLPEDPYNPDPNVDYTKPLIGESFEAFGIKLPFKGNYNKIEELVSSKILGNEEGVPNDAILRGVAINGMADIAVLQGFGDGVELWSPVSIFYFEAYYIPFDLTVNAEWSIQLGASQIDSYRFEGFGDPSERHYYAQGSLLSPDGGSNEYYVIDEAGNGTEISSPGGGGSSQITHLLAGQYSAIELSGAAYTSGSEVRIDINCWQYQYQSGDIEVEVFPQSGLSFPGTHNLDPSNGAHTGQASIPFTSLVADTWYMVEIRLSNLAARNNINSSDLNTDFIVTKVAFKTNPTNDNVAVTFAARQYFPYGNSMGINTYVPNFGTIANSGTGIDMSVFNNTMAIEIFAMNSYLSAGGGQDMFMYSVSTDQSGTDRSYFGNQLIINPVIGDGGVSLQRVIQIKLGGSFFVNSFEGCPYSNGDIYNEVYFNFGPSQLTQPINL